MNQYWRYKLSKAALPTALCLVFAGSVGAAYLTDNAPDATINAQKVDITCTRKNGTNVAYEGYVQPRKSFSTFETSSSLIVSPKSYTLLHKYKNVAIYPIAACEIIYHPAADVPRARYTMGVIETARPVAP